MEQSYNYIQKGNKVWCVNPLLDKRKDPQAPPYILGDITYIDTKKKLLEVSTIDKKIRFVQTLPVINPEDINISDMAAANDICEIDLLNNLSNRLLTSHEQFTNVGPTLLIVNPYKKDPNIYSNEKIEYYINLHDNNPPEFRTSNNEPHLYDLVLITIERLLKTGNSQSIIISGESGAGKTEAAKNAMNCIVYYFQGNNQEERKNNMKTFSSRSREESLEKKILSCNPILEAFGNCKTLRNDNSSRFGKYVTINIDFDEKKVIGANIITYLLEKTRITTQANNERTFHIFYQLLNGAEAEILNSLYLTPDIKNYNYLNNSGCVKLKSVDDAKMYKETIECFMINDFSENEIMSILKIVAVVLLMGNIQFVKKGEMYELENMDLAKNICDLLKCNLNDFVKSLTIKITTIKDNVYESPFSLDNCISARDSLAKELYNRLFLWIVKKMNSRLDIEYTLSVDNEEKNKNIKYIGLLDIYGFECFDVNSFEQLCINYANEQLQNLYINDFFKSEIEELKREGLSSNIDFINFKDNQPIIDLIDLSPKGIFLKLDDCSFQNKSDDYFVDILKTELNDNKYIILPKLKSDLNIKIKHSAKEVPYNCANFVFKNKDELKNSMVQIFKNSKNKIIKMIFFNTLNEEETTKQIELLEQKTKKKTNKFISGKFRAEMQNLVKELKSCESSYVRCLKPNELKKEFFVTPLFLFNQIQYLGILDTIKVRKEGFPTRKQYNDFFSEYNFLFPMIIQSKNTDRNKSEEIIRKLLPNLEEYHKENAPQYLFGKTKIFMKQEFNILLQNTKGKILDEYKKFSKNIRTAIYYLTKKEKLENAINNIENLQRFFRYNKKKINKKKKIEKINNIQALIRAYNSKNMIASVQSHYIKAQTILRAFIEQKKYEKKMLQLKSISLRLNIFLSDIEKRKRIRMRNLSKYILQQAVDNVIWLKYNELYQNLRPYFLSLLTKKKYFDTYKIAKFIGHNYNKEKVMKVFQMNLLFQKIDNRKNSNKIIHKNFITTISSNYFFKLRESTLVIQFYLLRYIRQKNTIKNIIKNYFNKEDKEQKESELKLNLDIFPIVRLFKGHYHYNQEMNLNNNNKLIENYNNISKKLQKKMRRCSSMEKIEYNKNENKKNNNNFQNLNLNYQKSSYNLLNRNSSVYNFNFAFEADFLKKNPEKIKELALTECDEFRNPKIKFFARILAIDMLVDLNEIYDTNWGKEFRTIYERNMNNNTPIQLISIGESNTIVCNSIGKVYSFGWNNNCQCGISNKSSIQSYILPNIITNNKNDNRDNYNYNNNISFPVIYYEKIKNLKGLTASYIHTFNDSCFIINNKGDCYSFGNNEKGQLGLGHRFAVENPSLIKILKGNVKCIKSCQNFIISLTKDSEVFLWYIQSQSKNKLKNDYVKNKTLENHNHSLNNKFTTEESKEFTDYIESGINYGIPFKINFLNKKIKISQISCGNNFAMLLEFGGILFGLGNNKNGELGLTQDEQELTDESLNLQYFYSPIQNTFLSDYYQEKIIMVKCGFRHTVCLSGSKRVYVWGNNKYGQLGTGSFENKLIPTQINLNAYPIDKIVQIQAGFRSSIFFTENRNIYYSGVLDKDNISKYPTKFKIRVKSPEICPENKFFIVRVLNSWSKNSSIFYVTVADTREYKSENINKINKVIDVLIKNWKDENATCPKIYTISNYFSSAFMK